MDEDRILFPWFHHYGMMILLAVGLGVLGSSLYVRLTPRTVEAWSILVGSGNEPSPRQLGAVAEAIFRTPAVYGPAMRDLGIQESPQRFLADNVDVDPVVQTPALIVVGRAHTLANAEAFSQAMAISLVRAFQASFKASTFNILGGPQLAPIRSGPSPSIVLILGGVIGLWLSVAMAVLHYRARRPVLGLERAAAGSGSHGLMVIDGWPQQWLGILRGTPRYRDSPRNRWLLSHSLINQGSYRTVVFPGATGRAAKEFSRLLGAQVDSSKSLEPKVGLGSSVAVVCHAGTPLSDIQLSWLAGDGGPGQLIWLR